MTTVRELKLLHDELKRRFPDLARKHYDFTDVNFPLQAEILGDKSRFQAWQCTRRFGKSVGWAKKCLNTLTNTPGSKALYLALTLGSAKGILWDVIENELKAQGLKEDVDFTTDRTNGEYKFKNKSTLKFVGVDSNFKEMRKILGQSYDEIGIDECGSMTIDMETLIMQMILAALSDRQGNLTLLGTAENIPNTFYQKVTDRNEKSLPWKIYKCSTIDNPYMSKQFRADMDLILKNNPLAVNASWFKTHWLNEWCADDDLIIIRFNEEINRADKLPDYGDWIYGLGVDLGFNDDSSFTVNAMSSKSPYLYTLRSFKAPGMDLTDVSTKIKSLHREFGFAWCIIDGANKQGIQEMQNRHDLGLTLTNADKADKATFLRLMADDYKQGKIKHLTGECLALEEEQKSLMWIKDSNEEDPRCNNHANDSQLYIWRKMRTYFKAEYSEWKTTDQKMEDQWEEEKKQALSEVEEMSLLF